MGEQADKKFPPLPQPLNRFERQSVCHPAPRRSEPEVLRPLSGAQKSRAKI